MSGFTRKESAKVVSIANNSGVSKSLSKIRKDFTKKRVLKFDIKQKFTASIYKKVGAVFCDLETFFEFLKIFQKSGIFFT